MMRGIPQISCGLSSGARVTIKTSVRLDPQVARRRVLAAWKHAPTVIALVSLLGCGSPTQREVPAIRQAAVIASAPKDDSRDWPVYGRTANANHFSPLSEINENNSTQLGLAWFVDVPNLGSLGAPLVLNGVLYYPTGLSQIHALDATTGREIWVYDPQPSVASVAGQKLQVGWGVRGIAGWSNKIYAGTQDGRLFALDAVSGQLIWSTQTTRPGDGNTISGPPTIFRGKVIIGNSGGDVSYTRGYVTAYDAETGKQIWRFYTVPGDPKLGFENHTMAMAARTWKGVEWKKGAGGSPWNSITYDEELNRIYIGTGNGGPWNQKIRSPGGGDNLFICSIVALDADTGQYVWHYQETPGDTWDYDSANDIELTTLSINGLNHRVILHAPKNGFFYVIDRDTGKLISAKPYTKVTWATEVDLKSGRPKENPDARYANGPATVWPYANGGHDWQPMSFSPITGLVYIPTTNLPGHYDDHSRDIANWTRGPGIYPDGGTDFFKGGGDFSPSVSDTFGSLQAWDPITQRRVWEVKQRGPMNGGVISTAGNLVLEGQADGRFLVFSADVGAPLWSFDAENGILNEPITYMAGNKQFITIITNFTRTPGILGPLSSEFGWDYRDQKRRVLTFALGGTAALPPLKRRVSETGLDDQSIALDAGKVERGFAVYSFHCFICHGTNAIAGGSAPDLRRSAVALSAEMFAHVVRDGALESRGMPRFTELSADDLTALQNYIRSEARTSLH